ncbi:HAD family hydrolase [Eleftheria terrae]|uniref:HAD family hydrolase n=1 Tax=Eleftheria terrae TaxID=1597781 RepID=UPI00263B1D76|nr:HAD family hydrolase [Eleftheria terrae]WKB50712.1 HAD family hydrolase [Eleftheria terrae]
MQKLLVLDLDETLIHATELPLERPEDFRVGPYCVYLRPQLKSFVSAMLDVFKVGVWTASGESYAAQVVERIFPVDSLEFVWSSQRCTVARDWDTGGYRTIKNLRKLKARGYALESIIAVDDTASKYARSYGNLVTVQEYRGAAHDAELPLLAQYLASLAGVPNVRAVEKRGWRERIGSCPRRSWDDATACREVEAAP